MDRANVYSIYDLCISVSMQINRLVSNIICSFFACQCTSVSVCQFALYCAGANYERCKHLPISLKRSFRKQQFNIKLKEFNVFRDACAYLRQGGQRLLLRAHQFICIFLHRGRFLSSNSFPEKTMLSLLVSW